MFTPLADYINHKQRFSLPVRYKFWRFIEKIKLKINLFNKKSLFVFDGIICIFEGEQILNLLQGCQETRKEDYKKEIKYFLLLETFKEKLRNFQSKHSL